MTARFGLDPRGLIVSAVALAWTSAATHVLAAVEHLREYAPYAAAFAVLALLQLAWGGWALKRPNAPLLRAGALGSLAVCAVWLVSRTTGLPFGPEAGSPEPVGTLDVLATATEVALVAAIGCLELPAARRLRTPLP
jgi:hypothetical protein